MATATKASMTDLRGLSRKDLESQVLGLKQELFGLRFQTATGQLENTSRLREVRHDIARIYTVLQERNLGIVPEPELGTKKA